MARILFPVSDRAVKTEEVTDWANREANPLLRQLSAAVLDIDAQLETPSADLEAEIAALDARVDGHDTDIAALDTRVTDLESESGADLDTTGSIFSLTGPLAGANAIVAYDFTKLPYNGSYLTAANVGGSSTFDLANVGIPVFPGATPFHAPSAISKDIGNLKTTAQNNHVQIATRPAALALQAAMTVEWLGNIPRVPSTSFGLVEVGIAPGGAPPATNVQWSLYFNSGTRTWSWYQEDGAGPTGRNKDFIILEDTEIKSGPILLTATRASDGKTVTVYINGRQAAASFTLGAAPTGGTSAPFTIGRCPGAAGSCWVENYAVRIFDYEFTADQAMESYSRTFYGVAAP